MAQALITFSNGYLYHPAFGRAPLPGSRGGDWAQCEAVAADLATVFASQSEARSVARFLQLRGTCIVPLSVVLAQDREVKLAALRAIVASGKCPKCGRPIRRNSSMRGWWQCSQFGAVGFRADASLPSCNWQTFTE